MTFFLGAHAGFGLRSLAGFGGWFLIDFRLGGGRVYKIYFA